MKISEVISKLQEIKEVNGDLDTKCFNVETCWSTGGLVGVETVEMNEKSFKVASEGHLLIGNKDGE
jgi:hypothetical protein